MNEPARGIWRPSSRAVAFQASMASSTFLKASSPVLPSDWQPGKSGTIAIHHSPSSSLSGRSRIEYSVLAGIRTSFDAVGKSNKILDVQGFDISVRRNCQNFPLAWMRHGVMRAAHPDTYRQTFANHLDIPNAPIAFRVVAQLLKALNPRFHAGGHPDLAKTRTLGMFVKCARRKAWNSLDRVRARTAYLGAQYPT